MSHSSLIPISRLPIPGGNQENKLVEYQGESDEDLNDQMSFFPSAKLKKAVKQELSDTFSIQEMTIESDDNEIQLTGTAKYRRVNVNDDDDDEDDSESQNLELHPPSFKTNVIDKLRSFLCCFKSNDFL